MYYPSLQGNIPANTGGSVLLNLETISLVISYGTGGADFLAKLWENLGHPALKWHLFLVSVV